MSEGDEGGGDKNYARHTYAYYKKCGIIGAIRNGWQWLLDKPERLTALSTFAIFLATAVAVVIGAAQWRALKSTDAAIHRQLSLIEADQRPWVGIQKFEFSKLEPNESITVTFKNFGKSPALAWDAQLNRELSVAQDGTIPQGGLPKLPEYAVLMPNQEFSVVSKLPKERMTPAFVKTLIVGKTVIYAFGRTDYTDAQEHRRCTRICVAFDAAISKIGFCPDVKNNRVDEDCNK